jgi:hypothetical protein
MLLSDDGAITKTQLSTVFNVRAVGTALYRETIFLHSLSQLQEEK